VSNPNVGSFDRVGLPDNIWDQIDELKRRLDDLYANAVIPQDNPADPNPGVVYIPIAVIDTPTVDLTLEGMALSADVVVDGDPTHFLNGAGGWTAPAGGGGPPAGYYGNGSDGGVIVSADISLDTLGTLLHFDNLTIDAGHVLKLDESSSIIPVVFVKDTLTINGMIRNNGSDGGAGDPNSGAMGGAGGLDGQGGTCYFAFAAGGIAGKAGGDATLDGGDGDNAVFPSGIVVAVGSAPQNGAEGGDGDGAGHGIGGIGGMGQWGGGPFHPHDYQTASTLYVAGNDSLWMADDIPGGSGGGGGGQNDGGGGAGGGGGHAGDIVIIARHIVWGVAGAIEAKGGNGGDGGASDGDGGGGGSGPGGNGGMVILCYEDETGVRNVDVSKGTGGTGGTSVSANAGANGPDGYDGVVIDLGA
jgi:hypothetical protein